MNYMYEGKEFMSKEAMNLYIEALALAHAPGSSVFDAYEAHNCTLTAVGKLIQAGEIEAINPSIAWMTAFVTDFLHPSPEYMIRLVDWTLIVMETAKATGQYPMFNYEGITRQLAYARIDYMDKRNNGLLTV